MNKFFKILSLIQPFIKTEDLGELLLDSLEEIILRTDNKIDDHLCIPVIKAYRKVIDNEPIQEKPQLTVKK